MKRKKTEQIFGVPPEAMWFSYDNQLEFFTVHKSSKKGQNSFRITKNLLESLIETSIQIQKKPTLIVTVMDGSNEYTITCSITKNKVSY